MKKMLSVLLSLVIVFVFCTPIVFAAGGPVQPPDEIQADPYTPSVSKPTLSTYSTDVDTTVRITFMISLRQTLNVPRPVNYTVYRTNVDTGATLAVFSGQTTVPAGSRSVSVSRNYANVIVGQYKFYVKLTEYEGATSANSNPLTVMGTWRITVELTEDRTELGTITLYNGNGTQVSSSICLGKSVSGAAMNIYEGNTPIGVYSAELYKHGLDVNAYGPYKVIKLTATDGYVYDHCQNRDGIWIHGGRTSYNSDPVNPLHHTRGCVRVLTAYQLTLETEITTLENNYHHNVGVVTITQNGQIDL